jgi:hypothetical protein
MVVHNLLEMAGEEDSLRVVIGLGSARVIPHLWEPDFLVLNLGLTLPTR